MPNIIDIEGFFLVLTETQLYLSGLIKARQKNLWVDSLKPKKSFYVIFQEASDISLCLKEVSDAINVVILNRSEQQFSQVANTEKHGRFLLYSPLHTTFDDLANAETDGFLDDSDAPPWSTWIGFIDLSDPISKTYEAYLIAWIPDSFVSIVNDGISVCLGGSLFWADDTENTRSYSKRVAFLCEDLISKYKAYSIVS
jgi:hypothetical protein